MQSMAYDLRRLFRYYPNGLVEPNRGGAVRTWRRSTRFYTLSFYPRECARSHDDFGMTDEVTWFVVMNGTPVFNLGDRLGDANEQLFEVTKVRNYKLSQQMEVREIARSDR